MLDLHSPLRRHFGFDRFRPGQEEVVRAAVEGRDTAAVMPTGAGKSLTYVLAAMLRPQPTLVLSPLIALMKDQVDKLPASVAATATFVNSSLDTQEAAARLAGVREGRTRLLFAAPERLRQERFVELLRDAGIGLVVVDEAHCVSMWGHDFRPDYLFIRRALEALGDPTVLCLTATATPAVELEIAAALGRSLSSVRTTVVRPNLRYAVEEAGNAEERLEALLRRLRACGDGSAIVYARSRRTTETLARTLAGYGHHAAAYHAGLPTGERTRVQDAFVANEIRVVVATTAFGMGIDKSDVRLVALVNHPDSLEGYVQMVGRAGRDGEPSDTLLLSGDADARALRNFALGDVPRVDEIRAVYRAVRDAGGLVDPEELAAGVPDRDPRVLVGLLDQAGLVRRGYDEGRLMRIETPAADADAPRRLAALLAELERLAAERVERIIDFGRSGRCRHQQVAEHFGEQLAAPCGACDVCRPDRARAPRRPAPAALPDDIGGAIVAAVATLAWPLGRRSLVALLTGAASAPPSARRHEAYGVLGGASSGDVERWVRALERAGALVSVVTDDGFRILRAVPDVAPPTLVARNGIEPDDELVARLRTWRSERSRTDGIPPYVILHDRTLREVAAQRPRLLDELATIRGFGPAKLERYGDELLAVCAGDAAV